MRRVLLLRFDSNDQGTFGLMKSEGFSIYILELPWRDNLRQKSCIPTGIYDTDHIRTPKFGEVFRILNVPDRSGILIHSGIWAGNSDLGYKTHSYGCPLVGMKTGIIDGQRAILDTWTARRKLNEFFKKEPFLLEIRNVRDPISDF